MPAIRYFKISFVQVYNFFVVLNSYDLNMICYYDKTSDGKEFFRFCYREREIYQLEPKVKIGVTYGVHYSLLKALNLGRNSFPDSDD